MRIASWWFSALCVLLLSRAAPVQAQAQPATVILVRHAEKAAEPANNPPLSPLGRERAEALLDALRDAGVKVIYATPFLRNMETARFVATGLQVPIVVTPIESGKIEAYALDVAARIRKEGGGRVTLVIGHSNTVKPLVKALGGPDVLEIPESQYDDLFVVTTQTGMPTRLIRAKYGKR